MSTQEQFEDLSSQAALVPQPEGSQPAEPAEAPNRSSQAIEILDETQVLVDEDSPAFQPLLEAQVLQVIAPMTPDHASQQADAATLVASPGSMQVVTPSDRPTLSEQDPADLLPASQDSGRTVQLPGFAARTPLPLPVPETEVTMSQETLFDDTLMSQVPASQESAGKESAAEEYEMSFAASLEDFAIEDFTWSQPEVAATQPKVPGTEARASEEQPSRLHDDMAALVFQVGHSGPICPPWSQAFSDTPFGIGEIRSLHLRMALRCMLQLPEKGYRHILQKYGGGADCLNAEAFSTTFSCSQNPSHCYAAVVQAARLLSGRDSDLTAEPRFNLSQSVAAEKESWKLDYLASMARDPVVASQCQLQVLTSDRSPLHACTVEWHCS